MGSRIPGQLVTNASMYYVLCRLFMAMPLLKANIKSTMQKRMLYVKLEIPRATRVPFLELVLRARSLRFALDPRILRSILALDPCASRSTLALRTRDLRSC